MCARSRWRTIVELQQWNGPLTPHKYPISSPIRSRRCCNIAPHSAARPAACPSAPKIDLKNCPRFFSSQTHNFVRPDGRGRPSFLATSVLLSPSFLSSLFPFPTPLHASCLPVPSLGLLRKVNANIAVTIVIESQRSTRNSVSR